MAASWQRTFCTEASVPWPAKGREEPIVIEQLNECMSCLLHFSLFTWVNYFFTVPLFITNKLGIALTFVRPQCLFGNTLRYLFLYAVAL
jgi:hypothetical protein